MADRSQLATQPLVHRLVSCVLAPSATLSDGDGDVRGAAAGFYLGDRRLLDRWVLTVNDLTPEVLASELVAPDSLVTTAIVRDGTEPTPDPRVLLERTRVQHARGFSDTIVVRSFDLVGRTVAIRISSGCDLSSTAAVKAGQPDGVPVDAIRHERGLRFASEGYVVDVTPTGSPDLDESGGALTWTVELKPEAIERMVVDVVASQPDDGSFRPHAPSVTPSFSLVVTSDDPRVDRFVSWSVAELQRLALADPQRQEDVFVAAGSPWFFTLFGRDSLWAARFMVPFGTGLAESTLRVLARRQGTKHDRRAEEAPGRILHELRSAGFESAEVSLPADYYGSVDATPLWMCTLIDAWRWGAPTDAVVALLPSLRAAAGWLLDGADPDGDGLCEYLGDPGHGLSNQGWKDSGDSVNWQDGRLAAAPIALCEVQGYAYEAALGSAVLLERFGEPGAAELRAFAARLREAFHASFWLEDDRGRYIAIGLDGDKRAITAVSSNAGHVIGTGLLDAEGERTVADRLVGELACAGGLRTLSEVSVRYNPISYHNGSVWPHDTAICARGMVLAGLTGQASTLLGGLVQATEVFGPRLPELYGVLGDGRIIAYPAACRPQAWAAASAGVLAWALAPVLPDGGGVASLRPVLLCGRAEVDGIRAGGRAFSATVAGHGQPVVVTETG